MQGIILLLKKLAFFLPTSSKPANGDCSGWMGKLASAQGQIYSKPAESEYWLPMNPGDAFYPGDAIRAGRDSQAVLLFNCPGYGNYLANLYEHSILTFTPEVLQKYFENWPQPKDGLQLDGLGPRAVENTREDSGSQG